MKCQNVPCGGNRASRHVHVTYRDGRTRTVRLCGVCLLAFRILGCSNATVGDDHPLTAPDCRHPDAVWQPDGCVIPTVWTAETVREVQA